MKNFKRIVKNQKGFSLIEVMAAAVVSVIVSGAVMKTNQSGIKGMTTVSSNLSLKMWQSTVLLNQLSQSDTCLVNITPTGISGHSTDVILDANSNAIASNQQEISGTGGDWILGDLDNPANPPVVFSPFVPDTPGSTKGRCDLTVTVSSRKKTFGAKTKNLNIPISCTTDAAQTEIQSCATSMDASDNVWQLVLANGDIPEHLSSGLTRNVLIGLEDGVDPSEDDITAPFQINNVSDIKWPSDTSSFDIKAAMRIKGDSAALVWDQVALYEHDAYGAGPNPKNDCLVIAHDNIGEIDRNTAFCPRSTLINANSTNQNPPGGDFNTIISSGSTGVSGSNNVILSSFSVGVSDAVNPNPNYNLIAGSTYSTIQSGHSFIMGSHYAGITESAHRSVILNSYSATINGVNGAIIASGESGSKTIDGQSSSIISSNFASISSGAASSAVIASTGNTGFESSVSAPNSVVLGASNVQVNGSYSLGSGADNMISGNNSFATGSDNTITGNNSFATGSTNNVTGNYGFVSGLNNTVGTASFAAGSNADATTWASFAFGQDASVTGNSSHGMGWNINVSGDRAHAFGSSLVVGGNYSQAFGTDLDVSSSYSLALGKGQSSSNRTTLSQSNTMLGMFNNGYQFKTNNLDQNNETYGVFISGDAQLGVGVDIGATPATSFPDAEKPKLQVPGRANFIRTYPPLITGGGKQVGIYAAANSGQHSGAKGYAVYAVKAFNYGAAIYATNKLSFSRVHPAGTQNFAGFFDGNVQVVGTLTETSDRKLKENITPLKSELDKVLDINGYKYNFKKDKDKKVRHGVIAQELENIYPELVDSSGDYKAVNYIGLIAPIIESIKELYSKFMNIFNEHDQRIAKLEKEKTELQAQLNEQREMILQMQRQLAENKAKKQ